MIENLEQMRMKYAWGCIKSVEEDFEEKYSSYVNSAQVLILTNGLGNALAFYKSKSNTEKAYEKLTNDLDGWFNKRWQKNKDILTWIKDDATSVEVGQITREILALLDWMKKFANAELKTPEGVEE